MKKLLYMLAVMCIVGGFAGAALAEESGVETENTSVQVSTETSVGPVRPVTDSVRAEKKAQLEAISAKRAVMASSTAEKRIEIRSKIEEKRNQAIDRRIEVASTTGEKVLTEQEREQIKQDREKAREDVKQIREIKKEQVKDLREMLRDRIEIMRESSTTPVHSNDELIKRIEERRNEMRNESSSTTPETRKILDDVAPMRIAVHALLSSRDLLGGGIGDQVSVIAREMNDSVASTTDVEAQIVSRGFLQKILFGGDKKSAEQISKQVAKNQERMQALTGLLSSASTTPEIKATLESQVQAIQEEQGRLQSVANSQSKLWGILSWRLF